MPCCAPVMLCDRSTALQLHMPKPHRAGIRAGLRSLAQLEHALLRQHDIRCVIVRPRRSATRRNVCARPQPPVPSGGRSAWYSGSVRSCRAEPAAQEEPAACCQEAAAAATATTEAQPSAAAKKKPAACCEEAAAATLSTSQAQPSAAAETKPAASFEEAATARKETAASTSSRMQHSYTSSN